MKAILITFSAAVITSLSFSGCASKPQPDPFEIEQRLVAAGFTYRVADTPEKRKRLQQLPQTRLIEYQRQDDDTIYLFADREGCNCVYVGDQPNYQRYLELVGEKAATQRRLKDTEPAERPRIDTTSYMDSLSDGTWKPWW